MTSKADTPINAENGGVITKKDLVRMFWRSLPMEFSWHYERQMHMGFEFMIGPALKKIYKDDPEGLKEALHRNLEFFNCTAHVSPFIGGITLAMEEINRANDDFDASSINAVKAALMGPLSGIGDSLILGTLRVLAVGIGGTLLYAGQIFHTARQLGCSLPLYLTNATDFLYEGDANFTKDSVVVVASLSGHTVEVEQAIDKAHEVGARVIGYVEVVDTPIANKVDELVTTVGGEYYWWYTVVLRFMKNAGQFDKYDELVSDMQNLPKDIVQVYKDADAQMKEYADKYCDSPLTYLVASGNLEDWAHCYGMCIMEEMQWMRTRPISAANFFHGLLEVIERDTTVLLIKGEDKTRPEMDRVENFVGKICANVTTIDTKNFELPGIRDILSPIVMRSAFMRLNVHLEHNRRHPLDIRRYYKCLDY